MRKLNQDLDLRSFLGALKSFGRWIALAGVAGALLGVVLGATAERTHRASAAVEVETSTLVSASSSTIEARLQAVELLLQSPEVRTAATKLLGDAADEFIGSTARRDPEAPLITISVTATSGDTAVAAANFIVQSAIELERDRLDARTQSTVDRFGAEKTEFTNAIAALDAKIVELEDLSAANLVASFAPSGQQQTLEQASRQLEGEQQAAEATQLRQQRSDLQTSLNDINREIREFDIQASTTSIGFIEYRQAAASTQSGTGPVEYAFLLAIAGLILGAGVAFIVASADGRMRGGAALEAERIGVSLLGAADVPGYQMESHAFDPVADADSWVPPDVRSFAMSVPFIVGQSGPVVIGVASPRRDAGGGLLAFQIAETVARSGRTVLFMDTDLERAAGTAPGGISAMLIDDLPMVAALDEVMVPHPGSLSVLVAGGAEGEAFSVLGPDRVKMLTAEARANFDFVVVDVPPLLEAPEAPGIARAVDTMIVVARSGETRREDLLSTLDRLAAVGATTAGMVVVRDGGRRLARQQAATERRPGPAVVSARQVASEEIETATSIVASRATSRATTRLNDRHVSAVNGSGIEPIRRKSGVQA